MIKIELDPAKCSSPLDCRRCLEVCPQRLFRTYPKVVRKPGKPAEDWTIAVVLPILCTGCMKCEQVCSQEAIKVTTGMETAVAQSGTGLKRDARRVTAGLCVWLGKKAYVP